MRTIKTTGLDIASRCSRSTALTLIRRGRCSIRCRVHQARLFQEFQRADNAISPGLLASVMRLRRNFSGAELIELGQ